MRLRSHCWKPEPKLKGRDSYHLGIELEIEAPDYDKRVVGLQLAKHPQSFYAKTDGSLNDNGWELVTHPIARNYWLGNHPRIGGGGPVKKIFGLIAALKDLGYTSYDNGRCGLHIHVSRTAFDPDGPALQGRELDSRHFFWFSSLVNGGLFRRLSQREGPKIDQWAHQAPPNPETFWRRTNNRYVAVNITGKTAEVRIFRGNMREDRIRKALEAVIAAIEFARQYGQPIPDGEPALNPALDGLFAAWVVGNRETYPNLAAYLTEIGVVIRAEDNNEEVIRCA